MFQVTSSTMVVGLLIAGVTLLLYGVRLITDAVQRATDARVQRALTHFVRYPLAAFGLGTLATALMQSSSAMSSLLVGLVSVNLIPLAVAIVMLLGANVGSTLVVQLLALHITNYALELVGLGALLALFTHGTRFRRLGQACFAFGLLMLGLAALSLGSQPIAANPLTARVLQTLVGAPLVLLLIGALLAMVFSSSAASIGLILTLAASGALPVAAALALMLGANVGTTLTPLLSSMQEGTLVGRRLALVHTGTKLSGALVFLAFLGPLTNLLAHLWPNAGTQVAMTHLDLNLALAILFVPLATPLARLMERLLPEPNNVQGMSPGPHYLDLKALALPAVALGQAMREILRMAEVVTTMHEHSLDAFEDGAGDLRASMEALDDQLDELNAAVKGYLAQLDEASMTEAQACQEIALLSISTDLQAIGDAIAKRLMNIARRKQRAELLFSEEGHEDLLTYHQEILEAFQHVLAALATHNLELVNAFLAQKTARSQLKRELHLQHMHRLRTGNALSLASSSLHLELLDAMHEMLSHITSMAYALREGMGKSETWNTAENLSAEAMATRAMVMSGQPTQSAGAGTNL
jgi:phosphate:Na+ symporter